MTKCGVFLDQIPHWKGGDESPVVGTVAKFSEVCGSEGEVGPLISRFVRCGYASTPVFVGTTLELLGTAGHHVCSLLLNGSENTGIKSSVHTWKQ